MTFKDFVEFLREESFTPVIETPVPWEASTPEPSDADLTADQRRLADLAQSEFKLPLLAAQSANFVAFALRGPDYLPNVVAVWVVGLVSDESAVINQVLCRVSDDGLPLMAVTGWERVCSFETAQKWVKDRLTEGYLPVQFVHAALGVMAAILQAKNG